MVTLVKKEFFNVSWLPNCYGLRNSSALTHLSKGVGLNLENCRNVAEKKNIYMSGLAL